MKALSEIRLASHSSAKDDLARRIDWIAPFTCLAVGVTCLIVVLGAGDGTWILYAREMAAGQRIYSDLALNLQPLLPLISLAGIKVSPGGILGDRLIFLPVLGLYVTLIFMISRRVAGPGLAGMALTLATFFTAIHLEAYRFDDYHAVAHCIVLASLYLSIRYLETDFNPDRFALVQGALAASAFLTRVNEGLAVAGAVGVVILTRHGLTRVTARSALICAIGGLLVFALVLLLVGETPQVWFNQTILIASEAKGGSSLATAPLRVFGDALEILIVPEALPLALALSLAALALLPRHPSSASVSNLRGILAAAVVFVATVVSYPRDPLWALAALAFVLSLAAVLFWAARRPATILRGQAGHTDRVLSLASYPLALFLTGALSSGGKIWGQYFPLALAIVVAMLILRKPLSCESRRSLRVAVHSFLFLIGVEGLAYRVVNPYSWHSYHVNPLFLDYHFEDDSLHGPHIITRELRELIMPVCAQVGHGKSLLSLPFSFANYYCGVPVWHGFVQTFFDASTKSQIDRLERQLQEAPPDYIFYQRQLKNLRLHEELFAGGGRLPHRDLDDLIVQKIRSGEWTIVYQSTAYPPSKWYLISTRKDQPRET